MFVAHDEKAPIAIGFDEISAKILMFQIKSSFCIIDNPVFQKILLILHMLELSCSFDHVESQPII